MTLSPTVPVRGVEGVRAGRNPRCAAPGCLSLSQHGHHIWSRSHLRGQPYEWVRLPDGKVVSNVTGLCVRHHDMVTGSVGGHKARIEYVAGSFVWYDLEDDSQSGLLFPQPQGWEASPPPPPRPHAHTLLSEGETCNHCGYMRPAKRAPGPKRQASTWTVSVPDDAEIGADILDGWIQDLAAVLGLDPSSPRLLRYHVLALVLAWVQQNMPLLVADVVEASSGGNGRLPATEEVARSTSSSSQDS